MANVEPNDLEEQKKLIPAQDQKDPQGAASESSEWPWWLDVVGLCKVSIACVLLYIYLVPYGVQESQTGEWLVLGLLVLAGHFCLLLGNTAWPRWLSCWALAWEGIAYVILSSTYCLPQWQVPYWIWWVSMCILFWSSLLAFVVPLWSCYRICKDGKTKGPAFWISHGCGYLMIASVSFTIGFFLLASMGMWPIKLSSRYDAYGEYILSQRSHYVDDSVTCDLTTSNCSLHDFEQGAWSHIRPGGKTACLIGEFQFSVYKGDPEKVILHLHGGGACWNWLTFVMRIPNTFEACTKDYHQGASGIYDASDPANPFHGYTVVDVPYCSGDMFAGDADHFWILPQEAASAWRRQSGYANVDAVLTWMQNQFEGKPALKKLTNFVVGGESAGSLGLQAWASNILSRLEDHYDPKGAYLIADSFVGVMPGHEEWRQAGVISFWKFCKSNLVPERLRHKCSDNPRKITLRLEDFVNDTLSTFPEVRYLMVDSKFDVIQQTFADMLVSLSGWPSIWAFFFGLNFDIFIQDGRFYKEINGYLQKYSKYPQFAAFLVEGEMHTFTELPLEKIQRTTPKGFDEGCSDPDVGENLLPWLVIKQARPPYQCYDFTSDVESKWSDAYCDREIPWKAGKCVASEEQHSTTQGSDDQESTTASSNDQGSSTKDS